MILFANMRTFIHHNCCYLYWNECNEWNQRVLLGVKNLVWGKFVDSYAPSLWFKPQRSKFQRLELAQCGMPKPSLLPIGLLPFPVGTKIAVLGDCFMLPGPQLRQFYRELDNFNTFTTYTFFTDSESCVKHDRGYFRFRQRAK